MIFNEIECHVNTSLGLVGERIPCNPPPSVRACIPVFHIYQNSTIPKVITHSSTRLWLAIQYKQTMKRSGDSSHLVGIQSVSPTHTVSGSDLTPLTRM